MLSDETVRLLAVLLAHAEADRSDLPPAGRQQAPALRRARAADDLARALVQGPTEGGPGGEELRPWRELLGRVLAQRQARDEWAERRAARLHRHRDRIRDRTDDHDR